jgi:arylsulfatase A-like enzyme
MFSSQYPHTHGVRHMFPNRAMVDKANRESPSLGAELQKLGYDTAVIGDWCACGFNELPMGFKDIIVSDFDNFRVYMSEVVFLHHQILPLFFDNRVGHMLFPKLKSFANYMTPEVVTDQVIDRLKQRADDGSRSCCSATIPARICPTRRRRITRSCGRTRSMTARTSMSWR